MNYADERRQGHRLVANLPLQLEARVLKEINFRVEDLLLYLLKHVSSALS